AGPVRLFQKSREGEAAVMPDDRGWVERDDATGLLQAPAKIDIVTGLVILGIETADIFKRPAVEGHVAARNVLCNHVREQNMAGSARRRRDTSLNQILRGRRDMRATHYGAIAVDERPDEIIKHIAVRHADRRGE